MVSSFTQKWLILGLRSLFVAELDVCRMRHYRQCDFFGRISLVPIFNFFFTKHSPSLMFLIVTQKNSWTLLQSSPVKLIFECPSKNEQHVFARKFSIDYLTYIWITGPQSTNPKYLKNAKSEFWLGANILRCLYHSNI